MKSGRSGHIRHAIDSGVNYFDTAPAYHFGKSEQILGKALQDGYREKVKIATKLPHWSVRERADMDRILAGQLATLKTDHIDYYLLHSLGKESGRNWKNSACSNSSTKQRQRERSGTPGSRSMVPLTRSGRSWTTYDWQFCQIRYNFLDEHNQAGTAGSADAAGKNLAVMVMEPLRGGNLACRCRRRYKRSGTRPR